MISILTDISAWKMTDDSKNCMEFCSCCSLLHQIATNRISQPAMYYS